MSVLAAHLSQTTSPDAAVRKPAEDFLRKAEAERNFAVLLLQTVAREDADMGVRVAGAIAFKNFVKRNWKVVSEGDRQRCEVMMKFINCPLFSRARRAMIASTRTTARPSRAAWSTSCSSRHLQCRSSSAPPSPSSDSRTSRKSERYTFN